MFEYVLACPGASGNWPRYADTAFSGEGARIHGGRWNSKGRAVVYSSESVSLAVLEQLVHVEDPAVLDAFLVVSTTLDEDAIEVLPSTSLPDDWRTYPAPPSTRRIGDAWLSEGRSLDLKVPSVMVRGQHNYLIDPAHPDFAGIEVSDSQPLDLDPQTPMILGYRCVEIAGTDMCTSSTSLPIVSYLPLAPAPSESILKGSTRACQRTTWP